MKKVLAFVLVLGMASLANAALTLQVATDGQHNPRINDPQGGEPFEPFLDSEIFLQPTDTIWIGIHNDQGVQYDAVVLIYGPGSWTGGISVIGYPYVIPVAYGVAPPYTPSYVALAYASTSAVYDGLIPGVGLDFEFHCDGLGPVTIMVQDLDTGQTDQLLIHQIPEPMTMALLGLGGLGLLRRRR